VQVKEERSAAKVSAETAAELKGRLVVLESIGKQSEAEPSPAKPPRKPKQAKA